MSEDFQYTPNRDPEPKKGSAWGDTIRFALLAIIIVAPIRMFIAQPFIVKGSSMDPTFATGQYLIVDEISYRFNEPERGDIIILRYPRDPSKFFIKRIVGLPSEYIEIDGGKVTVIDKTTDKKTVLDEPYVEFEKSDNLYRQLEDEEYFVMGDNRARSSDSRMWGPVDRDLIVGRAVLRLLPVASAELLPGEYDPDTVQ